MWPPTKPDRHAAYPWRAGVAPGPSTWCERLCLSVPDRSTGRSTDRRSASACVPARCEHPLALRRVRQPDPVRRHPDPPYDGVLALRPGRRAPRGGVAHRPRGGLRGDLPLVWPVRRDPARLPGGSRRVHAVSEADQVEHVGALSETVRARVVAIVAQALGRLDQDRLPASLRRVASFAPSRRARLAAGQIAAVLAHDDTCREQVAVQVRADFPELARALDAGLETPAVDPVDVAAVAYLLRPEGWAARVSTASRAAEAERSGASSRESSERADRLRRQLEAATEELKQLRRRHREQLAELKAENADLRHRLGDARGRVRAAEEAAARAETAQQEAA